MIFKIKGSFMKGDLNSMKGSHSIYNDRGEEVIEFSPWTSAQGRKLEEFLSADKWPTGKYKQADIEITIKVIPKDEP